MTLNLKAAREAYLSGQSNDLESIRSHIPTAEDLAEMTEQERHTYRGPIADLGKSEGAPADGYNKFDGTRAVIRRAGFELYGPGEHPFQTRFAIKRPDAPFTGRDAIRDLFQAADFASAAQALALHAQRRSR